MRLNSLLISMFSFFVSTSTFAHGEDKPGPNGGFIRMPGAFHTEVVPIGANSIKVFLLDMNSKSPIVTNSTVDVAHGSTHAVCTPEKDHFACRLTKGVDLAKTGRLIIKAKRDKLQGNTVTYELPLKLQTPVSNDHGDHTSH